MTPKPTRKVHFRQGRRGRIVRVVEGAHRGAAVFWVEYRTPRGDPPVWRRTATAFPRTRAGRTEALAFAAGVVERQARPAVAPAPTPLTVAELGARYQAAEFPAFRPNTRRLSRDAWTMFEHFAGPRTIAEDLGRDTMAAFRAALDQRGYAVTTQRMTYGVIRTVYRWAADGDLIARNRVGTYVYKVAKDERPVSPAEFRMEEFAAVLGQLRLDRQSQWRPHVVLGLCGHQGARQWAVLHLQWPDVDFDAWTLTWRAAWDKNGVEWQQPMRRPTRALLLVAQHWREATGYTGPWVFFPGSRKNTQGFYTEQSLSRALHAAEARAGLEHQPGRGPHGLRRLLAGEVNDLTGNVKDAMDAIGDRDIRMAMKYLQKREDRLAATFAQLDARLPAGLAHAEGEG